MRQGGQEIQLKEIKRDSPQRQEGDKPENQVEGIVYRDKKRDSLEGGRRK
jgi:hypothetical protein